MIPQYILTLNFECFPISLRRVLLHRVSNDYDHHPLSIHFFLIFQIKHLFQATYHDNILVNVNLNVNTEGN